MLSYIKFIPYIGAALLLIAVLWFRGEAERAWSERDKAQAALGIAVEANRMQQKAIEDLRKFDALKDTIIADYSLTIENLTASQNQLRSEIRELENASPEVKDYLNTPIPAELGRLLNN